MSPDGVFFPSSREEFLSEARTQALEFYGLRKLGMDTTLLALHPVDPVHHALVRDQLSIPDGLLCGLHPSPVLSDHGPSRVSYLADALSSAWGCGVSIGGLELCVLASKKGSNATAFDELPLSVLSAVPGFGWGVLSSWLAGAHEGLRSFFMSSAIHLCLKKKTPHWLLRNSRPIVLQPCLRRLEAAAMYRRVMSRAEASGWVDSWCFSYRKEMSPLLLGLFVRWCLAFWCISLGGVFVADWDKSNAFCNLNRDNLPTLFPDTTNMGFGSWAKSFFDSLQVFLQTPYGLAEPYFLKQGGAQGDSMGVCQYLLVRLLRSKVFRQKVGGSHSPLHPRGMRSRGGLLRRRAPLRSLECGARKQSGYGHQDCSAFRSFSE